jgi:hypothetical protein
VRSFCRAPADRVPHVSDQAQKFFPDYYKAFAYREGDVFAEQSQDSQVVVCRILKIDRLDVPKSSAINIAGKIYVAPIDDWLLIISPVLRNEVRFDREGARIC